MDGTGRKYVSPDKKEQNKSHQGGNRQINLDYSEQRMYGTGVDVFKFYAGKLNLENQHLVLTEPTSKIHKRWILV